MTQSQTNSILLKIVLCFHYSNLFPINISLVDSHLGTKGKCTENNAKSSFVHTIILEEKQNVAFSFASMVSASLIMQYFQAPTQPRMNKCMRWHCNLEAQYSQ